MNGNKYTHARARKRTHARTHARTKTNECVLALCQGAVEVRFGVDESGESWNKQWFATVACLNSAAPSVEYIACCAGAHRDACRRRAVAFLERDGKEYACQSYEA